MQTNIPDSISFTEPIDIKDSDVDVYDANYVKQTKKHRNSLERLNHLFRRIIINNYGNFSIIYAF